ncbi:DUF2145 domain-containing protein [Piscinibacter sp. XHJ-5]|uniref:DUF2145 domain-containing protein n=1 Tax=Piscinibacter sp. XHJ-5 TaxID=3037797 RepID=UPI00245346B5|nr:DUF2145 domain-containing protein [Piscinibacter sp. XHJ-5]
MKAAVAALLLACAGAAHAGRSCDAQAPQALDVERAMVLAQHVAKALDDSGAQVVALARIGQDLRRHGQRYSHLGFAYREGRVWRVVHKLNHCASATASVYRQGLGEFFLDGMFEYEAGIVVLAPAVQAALRPALQDNRRLAQMHTRAYSMVAYPWSQTYQQSSQWAIETLAMAQEPAADTRERAQAWLRLQGYQPATLRLNAFTRLGARLTAANIAFDDHPNEKRFSDRIETVTVDSVFSWLQRSGFGSAPLAVR